LRRKTPLGGDFCIRESLFDITSPLFSRSVHVPDLLNVLWPAAAARRSCLIRRTGINERCIRLLRDVAVDHERQLLIVHLYKVCRIFGNLQRNGRHGGDRLARVAHDWI
jgi:hypothetical protein